MIREEKLSLCTTAVVCGEFIIYIRSQSSWPMFQ